MDFSRRRDISLTVALCASLVLHGLIVFRAAELYSNYLVGLFPFPGYEAPKRQADFVVAALPADPWNRLGASTGTGSAIATSPGDQPLVAPKSNQDQPFLSLDPAGPGNIGEDPSESLLPKGTAPVPAPKPSEAAEEPGPNIPFGFAIPRGDSTVPIAPKLNLTPPKPAAAETPPVEGTPGADSSADPAPAGTLESDPTTVAGGVEFRAGATDVRLGRAAKITRPRLTLAARSDLIAGARPIIVLKIRTDPSGNVTYAEIFRSSGSLNVDQPCKLAAYNWWFEPPKDRSGKPVSDIFLFSIRFI